MKKIRSILLMAAVLLPLTFMSCKDKETTETETLDTTTGEAPVTDDPVMDTVTKDGDTIVRTGGGEKDNPAGEQVP